MRSLGVRGIIQKHWREFRQGQPGRRFQDRYERKRHANQNPAWYQVVLELFLVVGFIVVGIVLTFIPGPAVLFFALAAVILGGQSQTVARWLDWLEVKLRHFVASAMAWWKGASLPVRGAVILMGTLGFMLAGYCGYQLFIAD